LHNRLSSPKNNSKQRTGKLSKKKMLRLLDSLESLIKSLRLSAKKTTWSHYYKEASQRNDYLEEKKKIIEQWLEKLNTLESTIDLGANEGVFSKLLAAKKIKVIAADSDPICINNLYLDIRKNAEKYIQPLIVDLSNPTPAIGVNNEERNSFIGRTNVDLALALALVHHLAIGKNIPFEMIADLFQRMAKNLIIEFVPKEDEKVQLLLSNKKDIYSKYNELGFTKAFEKKFAVVDRQMIPGSDRTLFLMKRHND
jgi:ribosomal protein L11 methylase PrmA